MSEPEFRADIRAEYKQTRGAWSHESGGEDHRVSVGREEAPQGQSSGVLQS